MILRFKNVDAWRQAILLGVVPSEALGSRSEYWNYGGAGRIAEIDDAFFSNGLASTPGPGLSREAKGAVRSGESPIPGVKILQSRPTTKSLPIDGLWNLFAPIAIAKEANFSVGKPWLVRFSEPGVAESFIRELLRLGDHGTLKHSSSNDGYWIWASSLPYLTWLGLVDKTGVDIFGESGMGLWIPVGFTHPLEGISAIKMPLAVGQNPQGGQGRNVVDWRVLSRSSARDWVESTLSPTLFGSLLGDIQWQFSEIRDRGHSGAKSSLEVPIWSFPIGFRSDESSHGPSDLWVIDQQNLEGFRSWLAKATPDLRESFRYGVLGDNGPVILARMRELPPSPGGGPPGFSLIHQRATPGLYLPPRLRLFPDPGPEITRKLFGLSPEKIVWLFPEGEKGFVPNTAPRSVLGPIENLARFFIENEAEALKAWAKNIEFAWENIPIVDDSPQVGFAGQAPEAVQGEKLGSIQPILDTGLKKKGRPARKNPAVASPTPEPSGEIGDSVPKPPQTNSPEPVTDSVSASVPDTVPAANLPRLQASETLVNAFELAEGPWDSEAREALWVQLAQAWKGEGKRDWAALAFIHDLWKESGDWSNGIPQPFGLVENDGTDGNPGHLERWHESLSRRVGKPIRPQIEEMVRNWPGEKAGNELQNWFLTALVLNAINQKESQLGLTAFQAVHDILLRDCPETPVRLQWLAWLALGRIFGNPVAVLGGGERLLVRVLEEGIRPAMEWPKPLVTKSMTDQAGRGTGSGLHQAFNGVMDWFASFGFTPDSCRTMAIAQWTFAYGFARIGDGEKARELGEIAQKHLSRETLGELLSRAYAYRVSQAILGTQASGPLESPWLREAASLGKWTTFALDYLRETSRILEPHQAVRAFPAGDPLSRVLDPLGHQVVLGRICRESAPTDPGQPDAESRWSAILDRILLIPSADAAPLLDGAGRYLLAIAKPGAVSMRMGARILAGGVFFQKNDPDILEWMTKYLCRPPLVGAWIGGKSPGMDKGFFQFITRQVPLLLQLGERGMVEAMIAALNQGVSGLESCETKKHARFLLDCAEIGILDTDDQNRADSKMLALESQILSEVQALKHFNQQRNEPWQALCHKIVAYIQALPLARGASYREKLATIPRWVQPIRDHFATAPKARETVKRLCYQRHQVEWIEALVLAISEASPLRVPEWVINDEKLIRSRIRKDLACLEKINPMSMTYSPGNPQT